MESVFFSGSISTRLLPERIKQSLNQIKNNGVYEVLVGDAAGFDTLLQEYCRDIGFTMVTVYTVRDTPRNYIDSFKLIKVPVSEGVKGERKKQTFKDEQMTLDSDISFVVWDEKSTGSYNNIIRALRNNKKVRAYSTKTDQPINNITEESITRIYQNTNGLTASDLLDLLFKNGVKEFDNVRQLNLYLIKNSYVSQVSENNKSTYKTLSDSYSFDILHRGKLSGVRYKFELVQILTNKFKSKNNSSGYGSMRG